MLNYARLITRAKNKLQARQTEITLLQKQALQLLRSIETSRLPSTRTVAILCKDLATYAYIGRVATKAAIFVYRNTRLPLICKIPICYLLTYIDGMATRRSLILAKIIYELAL
jgi:hypothetical protein